MSAGEFPSSTNDLQPAFVTVAECRQWLAQTPLTNPVQALAHFLRQINLLNRHPVEAGERFAILEALRKPLFLVQEEAARRFIGKPLPLTPPERAAYDEAQEVWQALVAGYRHCLEADLPGGTRAMLVERALAALSATQFNAYRAGFGPPAGHWHSLHSLYLAAEQAGVEEVPVDDPLLMGRAATSVRGVWAEALLLHAAGPHELPLRHLVWVARWARRWAAKIAVTTSPPPAGKAVPLCVDLASADPAGYGLAEHADGRWLDTTELRQSLKRRLIGLEEGRSPIEMQLGDDCWQPACGQVLRHVYLRWAKGGAPRRHERQTVNGGCEIIAGVDAIHYFLSGRVPFRQPGFADDDALRRERDELATFGRVARPRLDSYAEEHGYRIETWEVIDESHAGVLAARPHGAEGGRIAQGQLLALRPRDAQHFLLATVRWGRLAEDGGLQAGIQLLPGRPEPVAACAADLAAQREPYRPAFLLPAIAALGQAATVVLPPGTFRGGRVIDIAGGSLSRIRLMQLVDRGPDFDRASFEPAR